MQRFVAGMAIGLVAALMAFTATVLMAQGQRGSRQGPQPPVQKLVPGGLCVMLSVGTELVDDDADPETPDVPQAFRRWGVSQVYGMIGPSQQSLGALEGGVVGLGTRGQRTAFRGLMQRVFNARLIERCNTGLDDPCWASEADPAPDDVQ